MSFCTACYSGDCSNSEHKGRPNHPTHPDLDPSTPIGFLRRRLMDLEREFMEYRKVTDATIAEHAAAVNFLAETVGTLKAQIEVIEQERFIGKVGG